MIQVRRNWARSIVSWVSSRGAPRVSEQARQLIGRSDFFDRDWYLARYPDVARAGQDPLEHFILYAAAEGRSPGPRFDTKWYLRRNADVASSGVNPLLHYLEHGRGEGRSIKAVTPTSGEDAGEWEVRPQNSPVRQAEAFANDFEPRYQARPLDWRTLPARHEERAAAEWPELQDLLGAPTDERTHERIAVFFALGENRADTAPAGGGNLSATGLGLDRIVDGWFAHARRLILRTDRALPGARSVVGFQFGNDKRFHRVTAQSPAEAAGLVTLDLENPLGPVLLAWLDENGRPIGTALSYFPSLYRGGLHHAEAMAFARLGGGTACLADYMAELCDELCGREPLLLRQITVQLACANGSEPIFQSALVSSLRQHFGVAVASDMSGSPLLTERFEGSMPSGPMALRRQDGSELMLPPDMVPSLASLCSLATSERLGAAVLAVVPQNRPEEAVLACLPRSDSATVRMAHPALPAPAHVWRETHGMSILSNKHGGLPSAIRWMASRVWQVDPLVPLSPDVAVPDLPSNHGQLPAVRLVLADSGTKDDLAISLAAVAAQVRLRLVRIDVLTVEADLPAQEINGIPVEAVDPTGPAGRCPEDIVIVSDTSVFAHDPRAFSVLCSLVANEGIAAASCAVTHSPAMESGEEHASMPWIADCTDPTPVAADNAWTALFPAASFDVFACDPRIFAVRGEIWNALWSDGMLPENKTEMALALARHCRMEGLRIVATTLVRVATSRADAVPLHQCTQLADAFADGGARERSAHLIRLMP